MNSEFIDEYDYENVQRKLMNSMHDEGFDNGVKKEKYDITKKMLSNGFDIDIISKITELPKKEIETISYKR